MVDTIYSAMEFYGKGKPYFGGTAADWCQANRGIDPFAELKN
nr:hypothetical protein [Ensifer sp. IC4062]